jgi:hypothetical protein
MGGGGGIWVIGWRPARLYHKTLSQNKTKVLQREEKYTLEI